MSATVKFCSCKCCRAGRHYPGRKVRTRRCLRGARRRWNFLASRERDEEITPVSIPYTD